MGVSFISYQHHPKYTIKTGKYGGGSLMVWAAFSWHVGGPNVKIDGKIDQHFYNDVITSHTIPFAYENLPLLWTFMHDNDPKHTSRTVKKCLDEENVKVLKWPPQSPDLNPIENLWNDIDKHIQAVKPKNLRELWDETQNAWYSISKERCQGLVESLPRRCAEVIKNKGYPTKY